MNLYISIIITLMFSAFFSGMEMAFMSANRVRLELDKQNGGLTAKALNYFYSHTEKYISTMLVGNNIALIVYGIFMSRLLNGPISTYLTDNDFMIVLIQTIVSTIIILFTAEYLPKTLFKINPNAMMRAFALPAYCIYWILYPLSSFFTMTSHGVLKLARMPIRDEKTKAITKVDLDHFIQRGLDHNDDGDEHHHDDEDDDSQELKLFQNALDFSDVQVRDCMIPRSELTVVSIDTPFAKLNRLFVETGYSKIPVYKEDIDNLIGYIHSSEMFRKQHNWQQKIIPIPFVPETISAPKVLRMLMEKKKSIAAVVDEFGGTAGIVTMEDLFEEIIGDIEDEHDHLQLVERKISDTEYELSGRLEISKINEDLDLDLPESDEYLTLAGLVLHELQSVPHEGDVVTLEEPKAKIQITKASASKIETVHLVLTE